MSAETDIAEIIRRRLFDWSGMPEEGKKTVAAYARWAAEHAQELTGFDADTVHERFEAAYPWVWHRSRIRSSAPLCSSSSAVTLWKSQ